ncbi:GNAT family N-acetyltransferase [Szabonella alba]|uniref:GNAT family N-acetyltransferase n=1 Tax=Szabonella alba TaxID=2804194 RepID=A0A8K0Y1E3_9RHOB|nr:GNAT family N-acetyltransferase [Szabonella alba]MBL4915934.1 GNAT family N-acetyltransferase [Szabonella alba]
MTPQALYDLLEASWPPAFRHRVGPWAIREGQGGGQRVSAATAEGGWVPDDIALAEHAMAALGQPALFMIRAGDDALDAALDARGYVVKDPVVAYHGDAATIASPAPDPMTAFAHWPPLEIARDIWAEAGIGPGRLAVMDRVHGPKCALLGRRHDRAAGVAFAAIHEDTAMLHALEVLPAMRRQGSANNILRMAAQWALDNGAKGLSLVVTESNSPARALYASLGMTLVGQYHYRLRQAG